MEEQEIAWIQSVLTGFPRDRPLRVFEYGSGGSTVYFPRMLDASGIDYRWLALEHDLRWTRIVLGHLNEARLRKVQLLVAEMPEHPPELLNKRPRRLKALSRGERFDYSNYTDVPLRVGGGFDVVLVDGRDRKNCLHAGYSVLNPGGIVLFHDAERDYYQCAFARYPDGAFAFPRLWSVRKPA